MTPMAQMTEMQEWDIKTILLAYDGSEESEKAAQLAAEVATRRDARVVVLTAFAPGTTFQNDIDVVGKRVIHARAQAESMVEELSRLGVASEVDVAQGPAADAIIAAAKWRHADLIVIGARKRNPIAVRLSRSTSKRVLRDATMPVLVAS
jgi:nucleotide-binding universal stress UspA family protein